MEKPLYLPECGRKKFFPQGKKSTKNEKASGAPFTMFSTGKIIGEMNMLSFGTRRHRIPALANHCRQKMAETRTIAEIRNFVWDNPHRADGMQIHVDRLFADFETFCAMKKLSQISRQQFIYHFKKTSGVNYDSKAEMVTGFGLPVILKDRINEFLKKNCLLAENQIISERRLFNRMVAAGIEAKRSEIRSFLLNTSRVQFVSKTNTLIGIGLKLPGSYLDKDS